MSEGEKHSKPALEIARILGYRVWAVRKSKDWLQQRLADEMTAAGCPMRQATIAKIESARAGVGGDVHAVPKSTPPRPVSLVEAVTFAVVLGVSPASLFLPVVREDDVQLTPAIRVDVETAWAWIRGEQPLDPGPDAEQFYRTQTFARRATLADLERLGIRIVLEPKEGE